MKSLAISAVKLLAPDKYLNTKLIVKGKSAIMNYVGLS